MSEEFLSNDALKEQIKQEYQSGAQPGTTSKYPTTIVNLPSKGLIYAEDNPLSTGEVELKLMTAKEEDILTSEIFIQKGIVFDRLLKSLLITQLTPEQFNEMILNDKYALLVSARQSGYGSDYNFSLECPKCGEKNEVHVDLSKVEYKEFPEELYDHKNEFEFTLPQSKRVVKFKLLTHGDEKKIDEELKFLRKKSKMNAAELTTRLKYMILSIDGNTEPQAIKNAIDVMLARDSMALREYSKEISPDVDMEFLFECDSCGHDEISNIPITVQFFWPNARV